MPAPPPEPPDEHRERVHLEVSDMLAALNSGTNPAPLARTYLRDAGRRAAWRIIHRTDRDT